MRYWGLAVVLAAGIGCSRDTHRDEPAARQLGREAYHATQDVKRGAKKAAQELREAGKEVRQGWKEAKRDREEQPRK
jgi:hypothetical protein